MYRILRESPNWILRLQCLHQTGNIKQNFKDASER